MFALRMKAGARQPVRTNLLAAALRQFVFPRLTLCGIIFLLCGATAVHADEAGATRPLRPFYIIGHGANTLEQAQQYLAGGANGLEVDVNVMASSANELCIGHGPDMGTGPAAKNHSIPLA